MNADTPQEWFIRPAVPGDGERVAALVNRAYERYLERMDRKPAPMLENYPERIAKGGVHVLVQKPSYHHGDGEEPEADKTQGPSSGTVVGCIVLVPETEAMLLDILAVDPVVQGRGYGGALMRLAEEKAREAGYHRIDLCTNEAMTENLRLYPHLGYRETRRATENGYHRVFFSKTV